MGTLWVGVLLVWVGVVSGQPAAEQCTSPTLCGELRLNSHKDDKAFDPVSSHGGNGINFIMRYNHIKPTTKEVDIVVHYHGFTTKKNEAATINRFAASGLSLNGRRRPTIAVMARGKPRGARAYSHPDLAKDGGILRMVTYTLSKFSTKVFKAAGGGDLKAARVILTAHSGGGASLEKTLAKPSTATTVHEVHLFDATYGSTASIGKWIDARAKADKTALAALSDDVAKSTYMFNKGGAFRNFYIPNTKTAKPSKRLDGLLKSLGLLKPWYRNTPTRVSHGGIPKKFGPAMLADVTSEPSQPLPFSGGNVLGTSSGSSGDDTAAGQQSQNEKATQGPAPSKPKKPVNPFPPGSQEGKKYPCKLKPRARRQKKKRPQRKKRQTKRTPRRTKQRRSQPKKQKKKKKKTSRKQQRKRTKKQKRRKRRALLEMWERHQLRRRERYKGFCIDDRKYKCSVPLLTGKCRGGRHVRCCQGSSVSTAKYEAAMKDPVATTSSTSGDGASPTSGDGDAANVPADSSAELKAAAPPKDGNILLVPDIKTKVKLVPSIAFDDERGNPYRVRRDSFGALPPGSPLRVSVPSSNKKRTVYLHKLCAARFNAMREAGSKFDFKIASGWRKHKYRESKAFYCQRMKEKYPDLSCRKAAAKIAFRSPHETGLAFDLGSPRPFKPSFSAKSAQLKSPAYAWLKKNAHKFGITPYKHEPWHWECVITRSAFNSGVDFTSNFNVRVLETREDNGKATTSINFIKKSELPT